MTALEVLLEALKFYEIDILSVEGHHVKIPPAYEVEVEGNGIYKLLDDGYIVAPFADINDLCLFLLNGQGG